jgi:hypothetical protein
MDELGKESRETAGGSTLRKINMDKEDSTRQKLTHLDG